MTAGDDGAADDGYNNNSEDCLGGRRGGGGGGGDGSVTSIALALYAVIIHRVGRWRYFQFSLRD